MKGNGRRRKRTGGWKALGYYEERNEEEINL